MSNKKPELSDFTKKFDLNNLVGSIKSLISPTAGTPEVSPDDAIGLKIAQMSVIAQQLAKLTEEQSKEFSKLNGLLNGLYQDIERLRHPEPTEPAAKSETTATSEVVTEKTKPESVVVEDVTVKTTTTSATDPNQEDKDIK